MLRVIALAIALVMSLGALLPLATDYSEASQNQKKARKRSWKGVKKYSKKWWQLYRAQERRKRALAARRQQLQERLGANQAPTEAREVAQAISKVADKSGKTNVGSVRENSASAMLPSGETAPQSWKRAQQSNGELQFRVDDDGGRQIGSASLSVVGPATGGDTDSVRSKSVGGVSTSALRRTVIDRMMREDGWVVNDYQKDVGGRKIYVVLAQSRNKNGQVESRTFYFTEVEGKIYALATNTPNESSERLATESEKVISSLHRRNRPTQAELR